MDTNPSHEFTHTSCDPIHIPTMDHHHQQQQQQLSFDSIWPNPCPVPGFFRDHILGQILTDNQALEKAEELPEGGGEEEEEEEEELGSMKEMMYRIAAMQPVDIDPSTIRKPKRRNVRISHDPQSIAARHRRERISERIRILQRMVPGGTKLDTASMLDEAVRYVKFLKRQIRLLKSNYSDNNSTDVNPPPPPLPCIGAKTTAEQLASDDWVPPPGSTVVSTTRDLSCTQQYGFSFGGA